MKLNKFQILGVGFIILAIQLIILSFILVEKESKEIYLLGFDFDRLEIIQKSFILIFVGVILLLLNQHKRLILKEYLIFICVFICAFIFLIIEDLIDSRIFGHGSDGFLKAFLFLFFVCFLVRYFFISIRWSIKELRKKH